ncbi:hypothetical protein CCH79_00020929, partial [Gambusia affinis]
MDVDDKNQECVTPDGPDALELREQGNAPPLLHSRCLLGRRAGPFGAKQQQTWTGNNFCGVEAVFLPESFLSVLFCRVHPAWFLLRLLLTAAALTEAAGPLTDPELVAGRLVFYQTEGGTTYLRDSGVLASGVATETVFELLDPERNFSSAGFSYTWDLGNGYGAVLWLPSAPSRAYCCLWCREVIRGTEPVVRYRYSESGNYTLRLNVGGDPPQLAPAGVYAQEVQVLGLFNFWCMLVLEAQILTEDPVTGKMGLCILLEHFQQLAQDVSISTLTVFMGVSVKGGEALSVSLVFVKGTADDPVPAGSKPSQPVWDFTPDAVRSIQLVAPSAYSVNQNSSLDLQLDGSPPMWVCWQFLRNCAPDPAAGCTLTLLPATSLRLSHTFTSAGLHCLDVGARNAVSALRTTFNLKVTRNDRCHLLFILSCAAILAATFSFILAIACRPRQLNTSQ